MTNLEIKISIHKLKSYSRLNKTTMDEKTILLLIESFAWYIAKFYGDLIEEAIHSNRYKGNWEPTDDEEYKKYLGTDPVEDIMPLIREALEVKKIGHNFIIMINHNYKYPGSKIPLLRVLRAIENGTSKFSARPIFMKIVRKVNAKILPLWRGYLLKKGVI